MRRTRLLVVEDHSATAGGMKTYLELMGYTVEVARNAAAARQLARTVEFDVFVCDLHLPDAMGWDLLKELSREERVPAVAFSAYDEPEYRENCKAAGFLDYIAKGSRPELLLEAIERAAGGEAPAAADVSAALAKAKAEERATAVD